jgi:hypothetical protein
MARDASGIGCGSDAGGTERETRAALAYDVSDALQALRGDSRQPVRFVYTAQELVKEHGVDLRHAGRAGSHCGS